ncbi:hypothetical protein K9M74_02940 [Candidatus Woesearchaeota archaeon]|nr:hypothetical protein [Candidatus Woesearchaeota archaeon]
MMLFNKKGYMTPGKRMLLIIVVILIALVVGFLIGRGTIPTALTAPPVA